GGGPAPALGCVTYTSSGLGGQLLNPLGIAASNGNVYVSNSEANLVSLISGGNTTTVAGTLAGFGEHGDGGAATAATLDQPAGVAVDAAGNIYIADTEDDVVRKIDAKTGIITRLAGTGVAGKAGLGGAATDAELDLPQGVAVDASGDVFIADTSNNRVEELLPDGLLVPFAGNGQPGYKGDGHQAKGAELDSPIGVAVDSAGNVYIADAGNNVIRRVDAGNGDITTVAGDFAADQANDGIGGYSGDGGPATSAQLHSPEGVALDSAGDLFIADTANNAIREVTPAGTISTVVNQAGAGGTPPAAGAEVPGPATASRLSGPVAIAVDDSTGTLYVADTTNSKVASVTGLAQAGDAPGPVAP
ncbi:MAG: hypothetical protein FWC87_14370, partial [Acidimicrobiaceae bacterium]|nr:hypothetical protein [Acidimicrobiaceae bacterium]